MQTFIQGKDSSLETTLQNIEEQLNTAGILVNLVSWQNPVEKVFSLHVQSEICPGLFANGKGTSEKATKASALAEFIERLASNYFFSDFYLTAKSADPSHNQIWLEQGWLYYPNEKTFALADFKQCLTPEIWQIYDPENEISAENLLSFNDDFDGIRAFELTEVGSGKQVYFPANILSNLYASNGLSAGNTFAEAKVQGLSEIFERWVKNQILLNNYGLPSIPADVLARFSAVETIINSFKSNGLLVDVKDASLGGEYPVICAIIYDQKTGQCFASFGAHPVMEVAIERTLTESLQGKHLGFLDGFQTPTFDEFSVAEPENLENHFIDSSGLIHAKLISDEVDFEFVDWGLSDSDKSDNSQNQIWLEQKIADLGFKIYVAEYEHHGLKVCRTLVPGMSEVYPFDELLYKNQNDGRKLRQALEAFAQSQNPEVVLAVLEEVGFADHQGVANLIGLMPDAGSLWAGFKIVDLQFFLNLLTDDWKQAFDSLEFAQTYAAEGSELAKIYQGFKLAFEARENRIKFKDLQTGFVRLFGEEFVEKLKLNLAKKEAFWGMPLGQEAFLQSQAHQNMLRVYQLTNNCKQ